VEDKTFPQIIPINKIEITMKQQLP